jgi:hypothetical protein
MSISGGLFLVLGVLFLLQDLSIWSFWNISWYTGVLVVLGTACFASSKCAECEAARGKK